MKKMSSEKPGILSSVIISLLAGFIYYQFGSDIQVTLEKSYKAVLSYSDSEIFGPFSSLSFSSAVENSDNKSGKNKKSGFYFKKRKAEIILKDGDYSVLLTQNQAKIQRSSPDKNIDFTSELNNLIKNNHQSEKADIKRIQRFERELAETGINFKEEVPLNKTEKFFSEDNSVSEIEFNDFSDEEIIKLNEINVLKAELRIFRYEYKSNFHIECMNEQDEKNKQELNSSEIHLEIHIPESGKIEKSHSIDAENENTDDCNM